MQLNWSKRYRSCVVRQKGSQGAWLRCKHCLIQNSKLSASLLATLSPTTRTTRQTLLSTFSSLSVVFRCARSQVHSSHYISLLGPRWLQRSTRHSSLLPSVPALFARRPTSASSAIAASASVSASTTATAGSRSCRASSVTTTIFSRQRKRFWKHLSGYFQVSSRAVPLPNIFRRVSSATLSSSFQCISFMVHFLVASLFWASTTTDIYRRCSWVVLDHLIVISK